MAKVAAISQNLFVLAQRSWRNKRSPIKKAVERLGDKNLLLSLAIAFFIVILAAQILSLAYQGLAKVNQGLSPGESRRLIYMMNKS
jgi:hypothetical protein